MGMYTRKRAAAYVRCRTHETGSRLGEVERFDKSDVHVHVPAGATPKDGPSAGVVPPPIGGVKEKLLAALRAGITTVMLPRRNLRDLDDIPAEARARLRFVPLDTVDDAVAEALAPPAQSR